MTLTSWFSNFNGWSSDLSQSKSFLVVLFISCVCMVGRSKSHYEVLIFFNVWPDSLIYITRHNFLLCLMKVFHLSISFLLSFLPSFLPSLPHFLPFFFSFFLFFYQTHMSSDQSTYKVVPAVNNSSLDFGIGNFLLLNNSFYLSSSFICTNSNT